MLHEYELGKSLFYYVRHFLTDNMYILFVCCIWLNFIATLIRLYPICKSADVMAAATSPLPAPGEVFQIAFLLAHKVGSRNFVFIECNGGLWVVKPCQVSCSHRYLDMYSTTITQTPQQLGRARLLIAVISTEWSLTSPLLDTSASAISWYTHNFLLSLWRLTVLCSTYLLSALRLHSLFSSQIWW